MLEPHEVREACQIWLDAINGRNPMRSNHEIWSKVRKKLGKEEWTPHELQESVCEHAGNLATRGRWYDTWYQKAVKRRAPHKLTPETWEGLEHAIASKQLGFVFYFRSLDQNPGGNTDIRVLKFTLDPELVLTFQHMHCSDGYFLRSARPAFLPSPDAAQMNALIAPFQSLLSGRASQSINVTIDDPQTWTQESATVWSSVEVMLFAPWSKVGPCEDPDDYFPADPEISISSWPLVARVHQRALCRNWQASSGPGDRDVPHTPAQGVEKQLLDHVQQWLGLKSPQAFGHCQDPLNATLDAHCGGYWSFTTRMEPEIGPRILPIYLRTP